MWNSLRVDTNIPRAKFVTNLATGFPRQILPCVPLGSLYNLRRPWLSTSTLVKSTGVAALGGLLFGFDTAVISGTTQSLTAGLPASRRICSASPSSARSLAPFSARCSPASPAKNIGRRDSLRVLAILYLVSSLGCALRLELVGAGLLPLHRRPGHRRLVGTGPDLYRRTRSREISRPARRTVSIQRRPRHPARLFFQLHRRPLQFRRRRMALEVCRPRAARSAVLRAALRNSAQPALAGKTKACR